MEAGKGTKSWLYCRSVGICVGECLDWKAQGSSLIPKATLGASRYPLIVLYGENLRLCVGLCNRQPFMKVLNSYATNICCQVVCLPDLIRILATTA